MLASSQKSLKFADAAANMRRLFGSRGGAVRKDVLVTEDVDRPWGGDGDREACVTYQQAERQGAGPKRRGVEVNGGGQTLNGSNSRAEMGNG